MALRVKISARAAAQTRRAAEWWAVNRPAAPGAVGKDLYYREFSGTLEVLALWHASRESQPRL